MNTHLYAFLNVNCYYLQNLFYVKYMPRACYLKKCEESLKRCWIKVLEVKGKVE